MQPTEQGPRRPRGAPSRPASRAVAIGSGSAALGSTIFALAHAGAPWWAIAFVVVVLAVMGSGMALAQLMLPQNSGDRLDWWLDLRRHRARHSRLPSAFHAQNQQVHQRPSRGCTIPHGSNRLRIPKHYSSQCGGVPSCLLPLVVQAAELPYVTSTPHTTDHDGTAATELDGRPVRISGSDEATGETGETAKLSGRARHVRADARSSHCPRRFSPC
jgi:hypothetical protein